MKQHNVLAFGNVVMDGLYLVSRMPGHDEKTFAEAVSWSPGGPAVHFAAASAKLGSRAKVLGWVGDDTIGQQVQHLMETRGIEFSLHRILNTQTPTSIIMVDRTGEKSVLISPPIDAARLPKPEEVVAFDLSQTDHFHTHLFLEPYLELLLAECGRLGISRSIDIEPSSVRRWGAGRVLKLLENVDLVFANQGAVELLAPEGEGLDGKLARIAERGPSVVICTRGWAGSAAFCGNRFYVCPSIRVVTSNSLAAGDIFAGSFMHRYLKDSDVAESMRFATASASIAVSRSGSAVCYPSSSEALAALERNPMEIEISEVKPSWKSI